MGCEFFPWPNRTLINHVTMVMPCWSAQDPKVELVAERKSSSSIKAPLHPHLNSLPKSKILFQIQNTPYHEALDYLGFTGPGSNGHVSSYYTYQGFVTWLATQSITHETHKSVGAVAKRAVPEPPGYDYPFVVDERSDKN